MGYTPLANDCHQSLKIFHTPLWYHTIGHTTAQNKLLLQHWNKGGNGHVSVHPSTHPPINQTHGSRTKIFSGGLHVLYVHSPKTNNYPAPVGLMAIRMNRLWWCPMLWLYCTIFSHVVRCVIPASNPSMRSGVCFGVIKFSHIIPSATEALAVFHQIFIILQS